MHKSQRREDEFTSQMNYKQEQGTVRPIITLKLQRTLTKIAQELFLRVEATHKKNLICALCTMYTCEFNQQ